MVNINTSKFIGDGTPTVGVAPWRGIHLHSTGNNAPAINEVNYLWTKYNGNRLEEGYYTHVVDGQTGEIFYVLQSDKGAWDIGGTANLNTAVAIELTETATNDGEFRRGYEAYVNLARQEAMQRGLPLDTLDTQGSPDDAGFMTHDYARRMGWGSSHVDPYNYLNKWGISYDQFKRDLANGFAPRSTNKRGDVQIYTANNTDSQLWVPEGAGDGWWFLKNKKTGLYLDISGGAKDNGAIVQVFTKNGTDAQKFRFSANHAEWNPTDPFNIIPKINDKKVLDVQGANTQDGGKVQLFDYNDTGAQRWVAVDKGDGSMVFINNNSSKALDVAGGATHDA